MAGFTTCTIPGYLLWLGEWGHVKTWLVLVVIAATPWCVSPFCAQRCVSLRRPNRDWRAGREEAEARRRELLTGAVAARRAIATA